MGAAYTPTWGGVGTSRRDLGSKSFELANHLGNVLVTVSDKPVYKVSSGTIYFQPEISSASDYYPFGAPINGRGYASEAYRYGYNGMEKTDEISGNGNHYVTLDRPYDARLGRWWKTDLMESEAPMWTPYRFGFNNPIRYSDTEGKFEIDEATKKAHPKLDAYLKNIATEYAGKPEEFKKAFKEWGSLSDEQVNTMLEYGKGPKVSVKNLDVGDNKKNGVTNRFNENPGTDINTLGTDCKCNIALDDDVVNAYEKAGKEDEGAGKMFLESTLLHEGTHYGDNKDGERKKDEKGNVIEVGKEFEKAAYGKDVSRGNYKEVYNENIKVETPKKEE
jgi:RHS repeat-associated protein